MATPLEPKEIKNLGIYGLIREDSIDNSLIPQEAVTESLNFIFDRKGAATVRPGITGFGATVLNARPCVGLHNAQSGTAVSAFSNGGSSAIYVFDGTTWNLSLTEGTSSVRIRMADFGSYTVLLNFNYNTYSSIRFWGAGANGASYWKTTGNPINPQNLWGRVPQFIEVYKSRIYVAGDTSKEGNPSRLYFSSVITTAGNITWAPTTDFVDINPGDGEDITGLKRFSLELLCFKPNYIYRFRTSGVDPDPLIRIGTRSNESIIEGKRGLYFHHDNGFYRYSGGYPEEISLPISDIVKAIPYSQFSKIESWKDSDHIYWSIGSITVQETRESVTYKNCVVRYTESSEIWTILSYSSDIRAGMVFNNGSTLRIIAGLDNGVIGEFNTGVTDLGNPIKYRLRTKWYEWEGIISKKTIQIMAAICEKAQVMEIMYQTDDNLEWHSIGQIKKFLNFYKNLNIKFNRIRFQIIGMSSFESPIFKSLLILEGINEGIIIE